MSILSPLLELFFPRRCPACGEVVPEGARVICTACHADIPLTGYWEALDNPVAQKFWGHLPIVHASSYFFFSDSSRFKNLIHAFKYHGGWRLALEMGRMFGQRMAEGGLYESVDVIIPIPLHYRRRLSRGYNQSEYLAEGMAEMLHRPVDTRSVRRQKNNPSQARSQVTERWDNVRNIFSVCNPDALQGKHILLVDDVLTTGATIISCAETILAAVPEARISIATLAVSKKGLKEP